MAVNTHIGIVRRNDDPQKMGRLSVWVPDLGGSYDDEASWYIVSYASPFAGVTSSASLKKDGKDMDSSQKSYGFWMIPPDLDNQVLVTFTNGDTAKGFWFACVWQQNMNHMVPGLPSNVPTDPALQNGVNGNLPPVVEYNKRGVDNPDDPKRPIFEPLHAALQAQGLYGDNERGPSSAGARRESPSEVLGFLTPQGHTFHFDDKEGVARLRMRNGAQIVINDETGYVYAITRRGNSWLELSDEGIDLYTKHSFSVHAEEDINFRSEKNINLDAGGSITGRAGGNISSQSSGSTSIKAGGTVGVDSGSNTNIKSGGSILQSASGNISETAGGNHIRQAASIKDNSGGGTPAPALPSISGGTLSGVNTVTSRMPTHEPWPYHPKEGLSSNTTPNSNGWPGQGESGAKTSAKDLRTVTTGSGKSKIIDKTVTDTSAVVTAGKYKITQNVLNAIKEGSSVSGVPLGYMMAQAAQESGFNPNAAAGTSSAKGLYQFTDSTWTQMVNKYGAAYGIGLDDRLDPRSNAIMGGLYARDNGNYLESKGLATDDTSLYMAHFLGAGGAAKFLTANQSNPDAPAYSSVGSAAANANKNIFYDRSGAPRTNSQVFALMQSKIQPNATAYAQMYGGTSQA